MGLAGLFLGLKGQDTPSDIWFTVLSSLWAAGIGFGIGSIFNQKTATAWVFIYWAGTLALVGTLLALAFDSGVHPDPSLARQVLVGAGGALAGILLGGIFGSLQLRRLRGVPR